VLRPLDLPGLRAQLTHARAAGRRAVAVVFMHGWRYPQHERAAADCARELGFDEVSVSHELSPLVRYVTRGDTTVLNAYLAPPLRAYVTALQAELRALDAGARLTLMQSNGGLAAAERFHAMSSVLSGPAGGLIGMRWVGERLDYPRLIGFDMGGTSTDVSLIDGELPQRFEHLIAGVRLAQPMLDVHSIAAGGGSILGYRDGRFAVGPSSAGADPGPACYGRGGPLTLTDVQVLLTNRCAGRRGEIRRARLASCRRDRWRLHRRDGGRLVPRGGRGVDGQRHPPGVDAPGIGRGGLHALLLRRCRRTACLPRGAGRRSPARAHPPPGERVIGVRYRRGGSPGRPSREPAPGAE